MSEKGIPLDTLLRKLGLWRGHSLRRQSMAERIAALGHIDFSNDFVLTGEDKDPDGDQIASMTSITSYDPKAGIFEDRLVFWRHLPGESGGVAAMPDYHVLSLRGVNKSKEDLDHITLQEVWWNGDPLFSAAAYPERDDPASPEAQRLFARALDISKRVKETLNAGKPVSELGRIFSDPALADHFSEVAMGEVPLLRVLKAEGGWDEKERSIESYFSRLGSSTQEAGTGALQFTLPELPGHTPIERLKALHGFRVNTLEPVRMMDVSWDEAATDLRSGLPVLASTEYVYDPETDRHNFLLLVAPEKGIFTDLIHDDPDEKGAFDAFEFVRLSYEQDGDDRFILREANFMAGDPHDFDDPVMAMRLVGALQDSNRAMAEKRFPPLIDIAFRHQLHEHLHEFGPPPSFEDYGGEFLYQSVFGSGFDRYAESYGSGIGGGIRLTQRGRHADDRLDEIDIVHGVAWEPGTDESNFDGAQADITHRIGALRRGLILIDHIHFDHSTIEFFAKAGYLKGVKVLCKDYDYDIMRQRLNQLEVPRANWPDFIRYDAPGAEDKHEALTKVSESEYAYRLRDEQSNTRAFVQICKHGSYHSALTDSFLVTGCYMPAGDEGPVTFHDSYMLGGDSIRLTEAGREFYARGQMALADIYPDVEKRDLLAAADGKDKLYIDCIETTNATKSGTAPTVDKFKDVLRTVNKALPHDHALVYVPFSTNHIEYQAIEEVAAEADTLRNLTAVGANAEARAAAMNKHGVNQDIDLRAVDIPYDKLPLAVYDAAMQGIETYLQSRKEYLQERAAREKDKRSLKEILREDCPFRVFKNLRRRGRVQREANGGRSAFLHECFFTDDADVMDRLAEKLGFGRLENPRVMPSAVNDAIKEALRLRKEHCENADIEPEADTTFWVLRSLANHNRIKFSTRCGHNDYMMYIAIMREQEKAARYGVRTSKRAKAFRDDYGSLALWATGPIGSAEEHFATFSRWIRGDSLLDYDPMVRNTGYKLDPEKTTFFITQTPSMGVKAAKAQEDMLRRAAEARNATVICAMDRGFKIYNPKGHLAAYKQAFEAAGWAMQWDGASNELRVFDVPAHMTGHGYYGDIENRLKDPSYKAKHIVGIHNPSWAHYEALREAAQKHGRALSIEEPEDWVTYAYDDQKKVMQPIDYLTRRMKLVQKRARYGQQYGWVVRMFSVLDRRQNGRSRLDPLSARTEHNGPLTEDVSTRVRQDWLRARSGVSARQYLFGPSAAEITRPGSKPRCPSMGAMLAAVADDLSGGPA